MLNANFAVFTRTVVLPFVVDSAVSTAFAPNSKFVINTGGEYLCTINEAGTEITFKNTHEIQEDYLEVCVESACEWAIGILEYYYSQDNMFVLLRNNIEEFTNLTRLNWELRHTLEIALQTSLSLSDSEFRVLCLICDIIVGTKDKLITYSIL